MRVVVSGPTKNVDRNKLAVASLIIKTFWSKFQIMDHDAISDRKVLTPLIHTKKWKTKKFQKSSCFRLCMYEKNRKYVTSLIFYWRTHAKQNCQ